MILNKYKIESANQINGIELVKSLFSLFQQTV